MKAKKTPEKKTDDNKKWNKSSDKKDEQKHKIHYYDEKLCVKKKRTNQQNIACEMHTKWNWQGKNTAQIKHKTKKQQFYAEKA